MTNRYQVRALTYLDELKKEIAKVVPSPVRVNELFKDLRHNIELIDDEAYINYTHTAYADFVEKVEEMKHG